MTHFVNDKTVVPKQKNIVLTKQQKKTQKLEKKAKQKTERNEELTAERKTQASVISRERLFTDKDFRKIDVALAKQEVTYVKRGVKRTHGQIQTENPSGELVKLSDIENIYKKRKHDKDARQKSVKVRIYISRYISQYDAQTRMNNQDVAKSYRKDKKDEISLALKIADRTHCAAEQIARRKKVKHS